MVSLIELSLVHEYRKYGHKYITVTPYRHYCYVNRFDNDTKHDKKQLQIDGGFLCLTCIVNVGLHTCRISYKDQRKYVFIPGLNSGRVLLQCNYNNSLSIFSTLPLA